MKCASDFIDMEVQYVNSGFSFKHVGSLRKVSLMDSTISYECLNSLPDTLVSLTIEDIQFEDSDFHEIKLPIHLRKLRVFEYLDGNVLSDIVNGDQLDELSTVDIHLNMLNSTKAYTLPERKEYVLSQLEKLLHELPTLKF
ncbi:unnamed protein product [Ambrosiozyma monospora]|uniref:Unnamed protein product n=1 Tax=Ambrosiozyma monospora TaxID=43982 RepID=A0ACB5UBK2_AMBMO|nr:unnamed protein product [Ambrosiozyma monospora]